MKGTLLQVSDVSKYMHTHTYANENMYTDSVRKTRISEYLLRLVKHTNVDTRVSMCACVCACVFVCTRLRIFVYLCTHMLMHALIYKLLLHY